MNVLLIFFALPIATIILAAVLQTVLHSPIAVSAVFFSIYLVITFAFFDANFLIATIAYTLLAFLSAALVKALRRFFNRQCCNAEIIQLQENESESNAIESNQSDCIRLAGTNGMNSRAVRHFCQHR